MPSSRPPEHPTAPAPAQVTTPTDTAEAPVPRRVAAFAILALATGSFGIGVTEFASMGVLPLIAEGLGTTVPEAGHAVSAYAIGVVVGAPLIAMFTSRWNRRTLMLVLMAVFIGGNLLSMVAPSMSTLLAARFVSGLPHGGFLGLGAVVAARLVAPNRRGTAMARVMLGLTVANIVGVPAATALGNGLGWRTVYGLVALLGVLSFSALFACIPRHVPHTPSSVVGEFRTLGRTQVWLPLLAGSVGFGGMFALYTYITPTLTEITGVPLGVMPWILALFGVGITVGSLVAGPAVDRSVDRSAFAGVIIMGVVLLVFGLFTQVTWVAILCVGTIGIGSSMFTTALQARLLRETPDAPSMSAAMNHAAFNLANAFGAFLGGLVVTAGLGYRAPALAGMGLTVAGVLVLGLAQLLSRRATRRRARTVVEV
ncbi:MFS transporter [Brevibacterium litoralis]|uniref:MFS transporter n=1 Tax=Brevibacterium litoralis TaxID=3138935 RepID=UPI0032EBD730